jgi:hypothetical protein
MLTVVMQNILKRLRNGYGRIDRIIHPQRSKGITERRWNASMVKSINMELLGFFIVINAAKAIPPIVKL